MCTQYKIILLLQQTSWQYKRLCDKHINQSGIAIPEEFWCGCTCLVVNTGTKIPTILTINPRIAMMNITNLQDHCSLIFFAQVFTPRKRKGNMIGH